ncbi:MAG: lysophospholipid acyltransferase family protein [Bacteroidetes bacterium]|nr:lysophospholipid acyltransferase family protein [Bacteroidota bacterium]
MKLATLVLMRSLVFLFRIVPFGALYLFSDLIYLLAYKVVGYRKTVVFENLRNSFPVKSEKEIRSIASGFYHHFCDLIVESMKAFSMKEEEVVRRYEYENTAFLDELCREGKSVICVGGHYNNWEWAGIASGTQLKHRPVGFYKPLSNKGVDAFIQKTRVRGRSLLASITNTTAVFQKDYGEPAIFYMVADQSPSSARLAYWMPFMNQDTAVLHGPEKYARLHNMPVVFAYPRKIKRGFYKVRFFMLVEDPSKTAPGDITRIYMNTLEKIIRENPEYYLWSHRRWKLKR